jgi:tRNA pseudouridine(38-40) synthase
MAMAINSRLPDDIEVLQASEVAPSFDAIRMAVTKQYTYTIHNTERRPLGIRHMVHHYWQPLDAARMNAAAQRLVGEHDFEGFSAAGHGRESTSAPSTAAKSTATATKSSSPSRATASSGTWSASSPARFWKSAAATSSRNASTRY